MKTITLSFYERKEVTIEIDELKREDKDFINAFLTDDDKRTDKQWVILEENSFYDILENLGYEPAIFGEIDVEEYS